MRGRVLAVAVASAVLMLQAPGVRCQEMARATETPAPAIDARGHETSFRLFGRSVCEATVGATDHGGCDVTVRSRGAALLALPGLALGAPVVGGVLRVFGVRMCANGTSARASCDVRIEAPEVDPKDINTTDLWLTRWWFDRRP